MRGTPGERKQHEGREAWVGVGERRTEGVAGGPGCRLVPGCGTGHLLQAAAEETGKWLGDKWCSLLMDFLGGVESVKASNNTFHVGRKKMCMHACVEFRVFFYWNGTNVNLLMDECSLISSA